MHEYIEILKHHVTENPPNYGGDDQSLLEMIFSYYHECNNTDTDAGKAAFEDLYQRMHGMPLRGRWIESWIPSVPSAGSVRKQDL